MNSERATLVISGLFSLSEPLSARVKRRRAVARLRADKSHEKISAVTSRLLARTA